VWTFWLLLSLFGGHSSTQKSSDPMRTADAFIKQYRVLQKNATTSKDAAQSGAT